MPASRQIAAVQRAVEVLGALAGARTELGTNELARRTGISAPTISRILATLAAGGLVEHLPATGGYRLGIGLVRLADAALDGRDVRSLARPHLTELAAQTGETATLSVPGEHEAITLDFVRSPLSVQSVAHIGRSSAAHATAVGKVLLANGGMLPADAELITYTARTIADRDELDREVAQVKEQGWARAAGEREEDLNAVAVPVRGPSGELTAIVGLQGPAGRFGPDQMSAAVTLLLDHARQLAGDTTFRYDK
jgi:IclR family acetate operon transcriptional repressor